MLTIRTSDGISTDRPVTEGVPQESIIGVQLVGFLDSLMHRPSDTLAYVINPRLDDIDALMSDHGQLA